MKKYLVLNGPNLNLLGKREPEIYGSLGLEEIQKRTADKLKNYDLEIDWFQSNLEGELVEKIQQAGEKGYDALIVNPAGYSHTSVAIYDALKTFRKPVIETHLTNVHAREDFRQSLLTAKAASKIMCGFGKDAYFMAILSDYLKESN